MIGIFLMCLVAVNAADCTTLHPNLSELIPYHGLNHLLPEAHAYRGQSFYERHNTTSEQENKTNSSSINLSIYITLFGLIWIVIIIPRMFA